MAVLLEDFLMTKLKSVYFCNNIILMIIAKLMLGYFITLKILYGTDMGVPYNPYAYTLYQFLFGSSILLVVLTYLGAFSIVHPSTAGLLLYVAVLTLTKVSFIIFSIWHFVWIVKSLQYVDSSYPYSQTPGKEFANYVQGEYTNTWKPMISCCESNGCISGKTEHLLNSFNQSNDASTFRYYPLIEYLTSVSILSVILLGLLILFQVIAIQSAYVAYKGIKYQRETRAQMTATLSFPRMQ